MMAMKILENIRFMLAPNHFATYFAIFIIFAILTFNGVVIFYSIRKTRNKLLLLGGGMITGPLVLLLILSIFSYFFKGPTAIGLLFGLYTFVSILLFKKIKKGLREAFVFKTPSLSLKVILAVLFFILLFLLYARSAPAGGDNSTRWGIATSFARGNYPIVLPWQPQFLIAYHTGGFMVLGAIHSLASANISLVHFFFSFYMVSALFIFITGIIREKNRSLLALIPAVLGIILFGGPILYLGNLKEFVLAILRFDIDLFVQYNNLKPAPAGAGVSSIASMYHANFYLFGLSSLFLFIFILFKRHKRNLLLQYVLLVTLAVLTLSIAETFFLLEVPLLVIKFVLDYRKISLKKFVRDSLILLILFLSLFFVVQNFVRDSLISPGTQGTSFRVLTPKKTEFVARINFMKERKFIPKNGSTWVLPDLRLIILVIVVLAILFRSKWGLITAFASIISLIASVLIVDPFWPSSALRFTNQSHQLILFALGFLIVDLFNNRKSKIAVLISTFLLISITPQIVGGNFIFMHRAITKDYDNLIRYANKKEVALEWISNNIKYDETVLFIDEYPYKGRNSPMSADAIVFYGIFVPTGPTNVKLISVDTGAEWYDAITVLSPRSLKDLSVDYVFIKHSEMGRFSVKRQGQIIKEKYFKPIYEDNTGTLYEVKTYFKELEDNEMTLKKMVEMIPDEKIVYLDKFSIVDIRKGLFAELANRTKLIGPKHHAGYDYFLYVAATLPFTLTDIPDAEQKIKELKTIDFVFTETDTNPNSNLKGDFERIAEMPFVALWKNRLKE